LLRVQTSLSLSIIVITPLLADSNARDPDLRCQGTPRAPEELARHRLLIYNLAKHPNELRLTRDGVVTALPVQGLLEANDGQGRARRGAEAPGAVRGQRFRRWKA
jgi:hypothetical protein